MSPTQRDDSSSNPNLLSDEGFPVVELWWFKLGWHISSSWLNCELVPFSYYISSSKSIVFSCRFVDFDPDDDNIPQKLTKSHYKLGDWGPKVSVLPIWADQNVLEPKVPPGRRNGEASRAHTQSCRNMRCRSVWNSRGGWRAGCW